MKKSIVLITTIVLIALAWSPWLGMDDDIAVRVAQNKEQVRNELQALSEIYGTECDGLLVTWIPFGRKVQYCEYGVWYVMFWGGVK